ncbi:hypothetical protein [Actinomadura sp. 7K507]|uniref:hypothetical protein n=1 Tax=Actinomadura sp. 7K507 TaxID=2530365 RepID=UPI001050CD9A|nr:hypothetical protein [Actinomadura sp. 7K507]TDC83837.1 hypothetical protein E1285_28035 [Actinomadura sp. 7K507]
MSTTQLIASAAATAAAAFGASYLGVYGTIIGAALMSVISTAGAAVGQHYLDQGRSQLKELTHMQAAVRRREAADGAAEEATSADPTRTAVWTDGPSATRFDPPGGGDPNATRLDLPSGDPNATRMDPSAMDPGATRMDPVEAVAGSLAEEAGEDAVRQVARRSAWENTVQWARVHWVKLAAPAAVVFVVVIGGITIYEAVTGQPIGSSSRGLTVTNVLGGGGGQPDETPSQSPSDAPTEPGATPGGTPTGDAPTAEQSTPEQPADRPTEQPTRAPTSPPTNQPTTSVPDPNTPAPTSGPQEGGPGGGQEQAPADGDGGTGPPE